MSHGGCRLTSDGSFQVTIDDQSSGPVDTERPRYAAVGNTCDGHGATDGAVDFLADLEQRCLVRAELETLCAAHSKPDLPAEIIDHGHSYQDENQASKGYRRSKNNCNKYPVPPALKVWFQRIAAGFPRRLVGIRGHGSGPGQKGAN